MIGNEREYPITNAAIKRFAGALDRLEGGSAERHPLLQQALREQVAKYDVLRGGKGAVLKADSLRELPDPLIRAGIATDL